MLGPFLKRSVKHFRGASCLISVGFSLCMLPGLWIPCAGAGQTKPGAVRGVILHGNDAREIFKPCSRNAPSPIDGYWDPSTEEIIELESVFPTEVNGSGLKPLKNYALQYAGFFKGKRMLIYVNGLLISSGAERLAGTSKVDKPIMVCDGGDRFFGMEYDPQSKTFSNLLFNGRG